MTENPDWTRDPEDRPVAEAIIRELERRRLSRAWLAGEIGVTPAHLGMVLTAKRTSHTLLDDAAAVLGLGLPSWTQRRAAALRAFLQARDEALADGASKQDAWSTGFRAGQAQLATGQEGSP